MNTTPRQSQLTDHLLGGGDLVRLVFDLGVRQDDGRSRGECRQGLGRLAVVEVVEAAPQGLAIERDHRLFARLARRRGSRALAWRRNASSRASVGSDCSTVRSVFTTGARCRFTPKW